MPRRPRPASRRPPVLAEQHPLPSRVKPQEPGKEKREFARQLQQFDELGESEASEASGSESEGFFQQEEDEDPASLDDGSDDDIEDDVLEELDVDGARVAQWVDDEEVEDISEEESDAESSASEEEAEPTYRAEDALASLSFGTLRKAQRELARASAFDAGDSDSNLDEDEDEVEQAPSRYDPKGKAKEVEEPRKPKKDIPKRPHKHAPTEVTSKKPVARKKPAVEGEKAIARDPRFLPMTGEFSDKRFRAQYGFLANLHTQEMQTLKDNLKRARKLLVNSPKHLREEREQEVQRLERAYKRAESMVSKDRREKIEQEALEKVAQEEKQKQKAGKGAWYMKDSDKKDLLLRAKYEALAASGGRRAVRKAIDRRQKKAGQKEKKSRPFAPGSSGVPQRKRSGAAHGDDSQRSEKRRRVG